MLPTPPEPHPTGGPKGAEKRPKPGCGSLLLWVTVSLATTTFAAILGGLIAEWINALTAGGRYGRLGRGALSPDVAGFLGCSIGGSIGLVASLAIVIRRASKRRG